MLRLECTAALCVNLVAQIQHKRELVGAVKRYKIAECGRFSRLHALQLVLFDYIQEADFIFLTHPVLGYGVSVLLLESEEKHYETGNNIG